MVISKWQHINADLIEIDQEDNVSEQADGIVLGAPTYMGSAPWQLKKIADATSKI